MCSCSLLQGQLARFRDLVSLLDTAEAKRDPEAWQVYDEVEEGLDALMFRGLGPSEAHCEETELSRITRLPRREALEALLKYPKLEFELTFTGFLLCRLVCKRGPAGVSVDALAAIPESFLRLACNIIQDSTTGLVARSCWLRFFSELSDVHPQWQAIAQAHIDFALLLPCQLADPNINFGLKFFLNLIRKQASLRFDFVAREGHLCTLQMMRAANSLQDKDLAANILYELVTSEQALAFPVISSLLAHGIIRTLMRTPDTEFVLKLTIQLLSFPEACEQFAKVGGISRMLESCRTDCPLTRSSSLSVLDCLMRDAKTAATLRRFPALVDTLLDIGPDAYMLVRVLAVEPEIAAKVVRSGKPYELLRNETDTRDFQSVCVCVYVFARV